MQIEVTLKGLTPLLMNRFTEENEIQVSSGVRPSIKVKNGTPREKAAPSRYADKEDRLYLPGTAIFAAMIGAGKFVKAGKSTITTVKTSLVPAGIVINEIVCPLHDDRGTPLTEWEVDSRSVVVPATGGRIMAHRPRIDDWYCTFSMDVDPSVFSEDTARLLLDEAGKKLGIGAYRPQKKGPFGRFVVVNWKHI